MLRRGQDWRASAFHARAGDDVESSGGLSSNWCVGEDTCLLHCENVGEPEIYATGA